MSLTETIAEILEQHIGIAVSVLSIESILDSLLEEFFYGTSLRDDFDESLSAYGIPTDKIAYARTHVLRSLATQVNFAFEGIWPSHQYSYQFLAGGDLIITEQPSIPVFGRHTSNTWDPHENSRHSDPGHMGAL